MDSRRTLATNWAMVLAAVVCLGCTSEDGPGGGPAIVDAGADGSVSDAGDAAPNDADANQDDAGDGAAAPVPFIMGHRGGADEMPENTLAAFARAIDGEINPEMDVRMSVDGHVVVIHDDTVDRTTDGSGAVADLTLAELQQLDAGSHFDPQYAGERIPTFDEVLELFRTTAPAGMIMSVDTKVEDSAMYDAVIAALVASDLTHRVFIEVTSSTIADELRARPGGEAVRVAIWVPDDAELDAALAYPHFERVHCRAAQADRAADAHAAGKTLIPGLINDAAEWSAVEPHPIDGINSNSPHHMKADVLGL